MRQYRALKWSVSFVWLLESNVSIFFPVTEIKLDWSFGLFFVKFTFPARGEMADTEDLKSSGRKSVWVRVPPSRFFNSSTFWLAPIVGDIELKIRSVNLDRRWWVGGNETRKLKRDVLSPFQAIPWSAVAVRPFLKLTGNTSSR